jgi:integrase
MDAILRLNSVIVDIAAQRWAAAGDVAATFNRRLVTLAGRMIEQGARITDVQRRLGHESPATTAISIEALESDENPIAYGISARH